ncbi:hypothetical protein RJT34_17011 [Clitoria ternatea]|uniref:Uncharacterized protein n=1 Tax=Clitoria ternatea TaxID=43366 RepID=A0AAN9J8I1_CLITE
MKNRKHQNGYNVDLEARPTRPDRKQPLLLQVFHSSVYLTLNSVLLSLSSSKSLSISTTLISKSSQSGLPSPNINCCKNWYFDLCLNQIVFESVICGRFVCWVHTYMIVHT